MPTYSFSLDANVADEAEAERVADALAWVARIETRSERRVPVNVRLAGVPPENRSKPVPHS